MTVPTSLLVALQLLTRIPVRVAAASDAAVVGSLRWYPLVGLGLGLVLYLPAAWPDVDPATRAALVLCIWVAITGALHLDGLADSADAWLGGHGDAARSLEIMRDPRIGAGGASAVVLVLLTKFAALQNVLAHDRAAVLLGVCALSRAAVPLLYATTDYVRAGGLGETLARGCDRRLAAVAVSLGLAIAVATSGLAGVAAAFAMGVLFVACRWLMRRRIGGATGDTTGATIEVLEAGALLAVAFTV